MSALVASPKLKLRCIVNTSRDHNMFDVNGVYEGWYSYPTPNTSTIWVKDRHGHSRCLGDAESSDLKFLVENDFCAIGWAYFEVQP